MQRLVRLFPPPSEQRAQRALGSSFPFGQRRFLGLHSLGRPLCFGSEGFYSREITSGVDRSLENASGDGLLPKLRILSSADLPEPNVMRHLICFLPKSHSMACGYTRWSKH
jgi:hypothetical protein